MLCYVIYYCWPYLWFLDSSHLLTSSQPVLLRTLEAILQRLINRDVILIYDDLFLLPCHRQMEWFTTKHHRLWYNQYFQEWAQQVEEKSDGLLHGPAGPPSPMASSALKDSEEQVRPHLVSYLVSFHSNCQKLPSSTTPLSPHTWISTCTLYLQKLESLAYISVADSMRLSSYKFVQWAPKDASFLQLIAVLHPRSMILVPIESAYVTSYWSVIVTMVLSCTVSKIWRLIGSKLPIFPTLSHLAPLLPVFPLEFHA